MMKRLKEIQQKYAIIGDVCDKGLMIGVEFVKNSKTKEPASDEVIGVMNKFFKRGFAIVTASKSTMR